VIRCDPTSDRVYVAAATGLYALDEPTSVGPDVSSDQKQPSITATVLRSTLEVTTHDWSTPPTSWSIIDMRGRFVSGGTVASPMPLRIDASVLPNGTYGLQLCNEISAARTVIVVAP